MYTAVYQAADLIFNNLHPCFLHLNIGFLKSFRHLFKYDFFHQHFSKQFSFQNFKLSQKHATSFDGHNTKLLATECLCLFLFRCNMVFKTNGGFHKTRPDKLQLQNRKSWIFLCHLSKTTRVCFINFSWPEWKQQTRFRTFLV